MANCKCYFCETETTLDAAIDAGWEPSFFVDEEQEGSECCPDCAAKHLQVGKDGEMELKAPAFSGVRT